MRGFQLTRKIRDGRCRSVDGVHQLKMLAASAATGVVAGLLVCNLRLHLGLPGHKTLLWMTPIIIARLLGRCKAGTTAGAVTAGFTAIALGGHIAGGLLGLPIIGLVGLILDVVINSLEKRRAPWLVMVATVAAAAMAANLLCLAKRLLLPPGPAPHFLFGVSDFWFQAASYAFFGLAAGAVAATLAGLLGNKVRRDIG